MGNKDQRLLEEYERLRPQHASNAATHRALMLRFELNSIDSVRKRIARARKRRGAQAKVIPMPAIPEGHRVKGVSTLVDSDGNTRVQWVKTDKAQQSWADTINAVLDRIPSLIKPLPPTQRTAMPANDLLALYPLADLHLGLYASAMDAERDWRLSDAVDLIKCCVDDLILRTPPAAHAIVAQMGDFTHIDNQVNRTPNSGAPLDADGRLIEIVQAAMDFALHIINRAASHHERVTVIWQAGNHDEATALVMQSALATLYRDDARIQVHQSGKRTHVIRHEAVALGFTHGDTIKARDLPLIMAADYPDIWGATRYRAWHCGHIHHMTTQEFIGCIVETHQSPAPRDAWHEKSGYRAGHSMCSITYDGVGEYTRNTIQIRRQVEMTKPATVVSSISCAA